ncbi:MAG: hypothetical protein ACM3QW_02340 [Ignavibacteriales bacterium]
MNSTILAYFIERCSFMYNTKVLRLIISLVIILGLVHTMGCDYSGNSPAKPKYKELKYIIYNQDKEVGTLNYTIRLVNDKLSVTETKTFHSSFLTTLKEEVKNHRTYLINKNYSIIKYIEDEYVNNKLHLKITQLASNIGNCKEVTTTVKQIDGKNTKVVDKKVCRFPADNIVYVNAMRENMFSWNGNLVPESKKYYFFVDSEGFIGNNYVEGSEIITNKRLGKRDTFRVVTDYPYKTYLWIDKQNLIILKKEEQMENGLILVTEFVDYKL